MISWVKHPEYVAFLVEFIPGHEEQEIREAFREKFGITLTRPQIKGFKSSRRIQSGTTGGRFEKGQKSHNKGKKVSPEVYGKCAPTMFKKGNIPANHKPVGSIREDVDGYLKIKIAEPNKWTHLHRYVWEQANGRKIGRGECVIFLDQNIQNVEVSNLMLVKRSELYRLNMGHKLTSNPELTRAGIYVEKIKTRIKEHGENGGAIN